MGRDGENTCREAEKRTGAGAGGGHRFQGTAVPIQTHIYRGDQGYGAEAAPGVHGRTSEGPRQEPRPPGAAPRIKVAKEDGGT